jgi:uncharacterized protein YbjT (DUF2867 family)
MILLTGATGKTGGEVARQLAVAGVPFRTLVRNPDKAMPLQQLGAEIIIGDVANTKILQQAMHGVERTLLVLPNIEEQLVLEKQFTDIAVETGVKHLVYLSSIESVPESTNPITQNHVAAENYIRASGLIWTMIRPTFFMQVFSGMAAGIKKTGTITLPAGQGTVATTDLRDVGEIICDVLTTTSDRHHNKSYDLTGPELLTMTQIAERFSAELGTEIQYVDQPMDDFRNRLRTVNLSEWRTEAVCKVFSAIAAGSIDHTTGTVRELLGRPPISLAQFIRDHRELFR